MAIRALSTAASGMTAMQTKMDVVANNLANVNTSGYKRVRASFEDLLYQQIRHPGFAAIEGTKIPTGIQIGVGTKVVSTEKIHAQGELEYTERDLDIAIEGDGFFVVEIQGGQMAYTRAGDFKRDLEGNILTADGYRLSPAMQIPTNVTRIAVSPDGIVEGLDPNNPSTPVNIGQITIARFPNAAGLMSVGDNLYVESAASGAPSVGNPGVESRGILRNQFLETSNVQVVRELVDMITTQRAFEINSKSIQTADEMLQTVNNIRR
ncbi:MAG: flagellar basal-body rod protein FlgG [Planctomycetota bacterium]|nr:flagellar basal-body rod protein FlgG [Planctomycetota bacterium]